MGNLFLFVDVTNPTWLVYVALLVVAVYFRFSRIFTIRNLDLALLLLISTAIVVTGDYRHAPVEKLSAAEDSGSVDVAAAALSEAPREADAHDRVSSPIVSDDSSPAVDPSTPGVTENPAAPAEGESSSGDAPSGEEKFVYPEYKWGSMALMGLTVLLLVRLIFDESLTRRPRLEQNLNQAGLTFLCIPSFAILRVGHSE